MDSKKTIALELGYHRYTALAMIPLLSTLQKYQIKEILATGSGAIIGALIGMQVPQEEMLEFVLSINAKRLKEQLKNRFKDATLDALSPKLTVLTSNSYTAEPVLLTSGKLAEVLYAANATFPFCKPQKINNKSLVSGLYCEYLPTYKKKPPVDKMIALNVHGYNLESLTKPYEKFNAFYERTYYRLETDDKFKTSPSRYVINLHFPYPQKDVEPLYEKVLQEGEILCNII